MVGKFRKSPVLALAGLGILFSLHGKAADDPALPPITGLKSNTSNSGVATEPPPSQGAAKPGQTQPTQQPGQQQQQDTIIADPGASKSLGRFRTKDGTVKVAEMFLDRYKEAMVTVTVRDGGGNVLGSGMGVALGEGGGRSARYIAAPLSVVLGNSVQWADEVVITQHDGEQYNADIALVNEQLDLVLLDPEIRPAAIPFTRAIDERPQTSLFIIVHNQSSAPGTPTKSKVMMGKLAGLNQDKGTLSVTKDNSALRTFPWELKPEHAGTGLINSQGELVGILLPKQKGVLASALQQLVTKASKLKAMPPAMLGVVMGRGVLVSPSVEGAYKSVNAAIAAIESGEAPRMDPKRFTPARDRELSPAEAERVVVKVMEGKYLEEKPVLLRDHFSLVGSGPDLTVISGKSSPVLQADGLEDVVITGLRLQPPAQQLGSDSTFHVRGSRRVQITGNVLEARGGSALRLEKSKEVTVAGNVFPAGKSNSKGVVCENSNLEFEANGIFGPWGQGVMAGDGCSAKLQRNLVMQAGNGMAAGAQTPSFQVKFNTFIDADVGVHLLGSPAKFVLQNNVFFRGNFGLLSQTQVAASSLGRNSTWKSAFAVKSNRITSSRIIRSETSFQNPALFDFRVKPGGPESGTADDEANMDLGAFQRADFVGPWTSQFLRALIAATKNEKIAPAWGFTNF